MVNSSYDQLRRQNQGLRDLVVQLSIIILRSLVEQTRLPNLFRGEASPPLPEPISPIEIAPHLREVAIRCAHLSRIYADPQIGQELESFGVELADVAERLETLIVRDAS